LNIIQNYKFYSRNNFRNPPIFFEKRKSLLIAPAMRIHTYISAICNRNTR